jgi:hypothetical protein
MGLVASVLAGDILFSTCARATSPSVANPTSAIFWIDSTGFSPRATGVPPALVEFVNRDTVAHDIRSDPHPAHSACPEFNLGSIAPGGRAAIPAPLDRGRSCGFHDETRLGDTRFQGSIDVR